MGSPSNIITMRTLVLSLSLLLVFLDVLVVGDPDIDRTFGLFKKKKEKVKDKIKKPKYNPCSRRSFLLADEMDDIQDRTFKLFHKKKEKIKEDKKKCEGYRRTFHKKKKKEKKPSYKPRPSYRPPSYHPPQPAHFGPRPGHIPFPIQATRHFGSSVVGPHHSWPKTPHFGPVGYHNNFPF